MEAENHRYSGFQWVLYIVILPLLFTALLSGIILQFFGFDIAGKVADAARSIPVVGQWLPDAEDEATANLDPAEQLAQAQTQVTKLEADSKQLQSDLDKKDAEIERLKQQIEDLKKKKAAAAAQADAENDSVAQADDSLVAQAKVYAEMSPSKAAPILGQLSVTLAKQILDNMTIDQQAAILEKMDPAIAGQILSQ
ncbi:MAG TPA: hypothetical protein VFV52_10395 [Bacilli bacterium]|nr:hypothetical protein [Bacilli bacterium]